MNVYSNDIYTNLLTQGRGFNKKGCHNLSLGFAIKGRAWKGVGQECNMGVTFTLSRVQESVREWVHRLPSEFPFWELKSEWTLKYSKSGKLKGQNSLDWKFLYIIGKFLKHRCLNWACIIHLSTYDTSYGRKKGRESKCQFDFWSLKVRNHPKLHACKRHATYHWKVLD